MTQVVMQRCCCTFEVPSHAAASVEHAAAGIEPSPEQLIEQVDIDVAELAAKRFADHRLTAT